MRPLYQKTRLEKGVDLAGWILLAAFVGYLLSHIGAWIL